MKAIKDVVEKGTIISYTSNYMDSGVDRYVIAGKGKIDGKYVYVEVVIKSYPRTKNNSKFYLYENNNRSRFTVNDCTAIKRRYSG
ncbi:MAG: hypothetical protein IJA34_04005 [Lachnospiraceae bacterium]|nr:hypothetical protein [Lachnospiraceae bacterium]